MSSLGPSFAKNFPVASSKRCNHKVIVHMKGVLLLKRMRPGGFSLVEVMLSLGIVTFSIIACVGLNVTSLGTLRDATAQDISGRIFRSLMNEALATAFVDLDQMSGVRTFGAEGEPVSTGTGDRQVYFSRVEIVAPKVQEGNAARTLDGARNLRVSIFRGIESANTLVASRTLTIGNRSKEH